ncbi:hypothetical protein C8F01DRAFT_1188316, partial [Mycena amicta]
MRRVISWAGALEQPWTAAAHPDFETVVTTHYDKYIGTPAITDKVYLVAGNAIDCWRSGLGKYALVVVQILLEGNKDENGKKLPGTGRTKDEMASLARSLRKNDNFLYESWENGNSRRICDDSFTSGVYRSSLMLAMIAENLRKGGHCDDSLALVLQVQRALRFFKTGELVTPSETGQKPASYYLGASSDLLSTDKQAKILELATASAGEAAETDSDGSDGRGGTEP